MERRQESSRQGEQRPLKEQSPDEARRTVKEKVSRGVATVAGALEGFARQMRENDVPERAKEAVQKVGETTRKVSEATRRETREVKQAVGSPGERRPERPGVTGTAHALAGGGTSAAEGAGPESPSGTSQRTSQAHTAGTGSKEEPGKVRRTHEETDFSRR